MVANRNGNVAKIQQKRKIRNVPCAGGVYGAAAEPGEVAGGPIDGTNLQMCVIP
jgi:hypothetical protein